MTDSSRRSSFTSRSAISNRRSSLTGSTISHRSSSSSSSRVSSLFSSDDSSHGGDNKTSPEEQKPSTHHLGLLVNAFNAWVFQLDYKKPIEEHTLPQEHKLPTDQSVIDPEADSFKKLMQCSLQFIRRLKSEHLEADLLKAKTKTKETGDAGLLCDADKLNTLFVSNFSAKIKIEDMPSSLTSPADDLSSTITLTTHQCKDLALRIEKQNMKMTIEVDMELIPAAYSSLLRKRLRKDPTRSLVFNIETDQQFEERVKLMYERVLMILNLIKNTLESKLANTSSMRCYPLQDIFYENISEDFRESGVDTFARLDRYITLTQQNKVFPDHTQLYTKLSSFKKLLENYNREYGEFPNVSEILTVLCDDTIQLIQNAGKKTIDICEEANQYQKKWSQIPEFFLSDSDRVRLLRAVAAIALGVIIWSLGISCLAIIVGLMCKQIYAVSIIKSLAVLWHQAEAGAIMHTIVGVFGPVGVAASGLFGYNRFRYCGYFNSFSNPIEKALGAVAEEVRSLRL